MPNYVIRFPTTATILSDVLAFLAGLVFGRTIITMFISVIPETISNYRNNTIIREILIPALLGPNGNLNVEQILVMIILSAIIVLLIVKLTKRIVELTALFLLGLITHNIILVLTGVDVDVNVITSAISSMLGQNTSSA